MNLKGLTEARGPSGDEAAVRDVILAEVGDLVDEHRVDPLGNLICLRRARVTPGPAFPRKVMLSAHMDEIGLIITGINGDGTLRFGKIGGIDDRVLAARTVYVGKDRVPGVIGVAPIHLVDSSARGKAVSADKLAIDIGATSKAGAERLVKPGDYATFRVEYQELGGDDPLRAAKGKAFDDRAGCAVLIEALKGDYAFDVYGVFTAQEEVGLRGARVAAYSVAPDLAINLEGTICDDLPKDEDTSPVTRVGDGPAISFMDLSVIADQRLVRLLVRTAEANGIPYQFKRAVAGGTDAGAIHLAREGIPAVTVAVPVRYIHAPACLLSLNDVDHTAALVTAALHALEKGLPS